MASDELKAKAKELGITHHPMLGDEKLQALIDAKLAEFNSDESEKEPEAAEKITPSSTEIFSKLAKSYKYSGGVIISPGKNKISADELKKLEADKVFKRHVKNNSIEK